MLHEMVKNACGPKIPLCVKLNTRSLHFLIRYMACIKSLFTNTPPLAPWIRTVSPALAFSLQETNSKHHMSSSNKLKRGKHLSYSIVNNISIALLRNNGQVCNWSSTYQPEIL